MIEGDAAIDVVCQLLSVIDGLSWLRGFGDMLACHRMFSLSKLCEQLVLL